MLNEAYKVRFADICTDPYPHLIIDNFFDNIRYGDILKNFPSNEQLIDGGEFSKQLDLIIDPGVARADESWSYDKHMTGEQLEFWTEFKHEFLDSMEFGDAFLGKFQIPHIKLDRYVCGRIQVERKGSGLGPHRDRFDKLISCVIYLDDCPEACGTKLLEPKNPALFGFEEHLGYSEFNVVKEVEHKPNRMICWPVVDNSFHSYFQDKPVERKTIKLFVQEKQDISKLRERIAKTKNTANKWREDVING